MVVVQVDQHRRERQSFLTSFVRAAFRDLVETAEEPLEMIRNQLPVLPRQVIEGVVDRAERARSPLLVEVTAETLWTACGTRANVVRQFALFALEFGYHRLPPGEEVIVTPLITELMIHSLESSRTIFWAPAPGPDTVVRSRSETGAGQS